MADVYLSTITSALGLEDPEDFQRALDQLIKSIVKSEVRATKEKLKELIKHNATECKFNKEQVGSQLESANRAIKALSSELNEVEDQRAEDARQLKKSQTAKADAEEKIEQFLQEIDFIQNSLVHITSELSMKTSIMDMERLANKVSTMCPLLYAEKVEFSVRNKANETDVQRVQEELDKMRDYLKAKFMERSEIESYFRKMQEKTENSTKTYINSQTFTRAIHDLEKTLDSMKHEHIEAFDTAQLHLEDVKLTCKQLQEDVLTKASIVDMGEVKEYICTLATEKRLEELKDRLDTETVRLGQAKYDLETTLKEHENVLERFDEILLDKANKADMMEIAKKMASCVSVEELGKKVEDVEGDINTLLRLNAEAEHTKTELESKLRDLTHTLTALKTEKRDFAAITNAIETISESLDSKAEKSEIASINDSKASNLEVQSVIRSLGVMYRIDKLLIMLLEHSTKCMSEMSAEVSPANFSATEWLSKHAEMVSAWANLYEPIENEIEFPPDIMNMLPEKSAKLIGVKPVSSPLGLTPRRKSPLLTPHHFASGQITKKLLAKRNESVKRNGVHLPSLEATFDS